jgi:hypothetical protein
LAAKRKGFMEKERNFQRPLKKSEQCVSFFGFSAFYLLVWLLALFFSRLFASSPEKIPSVNATTNGFYVKKHFTLPHLVLHANHPSQMFCAHPSH